MTTTTRPRRTRKATQENSAGPSSQPSSVGDIAQPNSVEAPKDPSPIQPGVEPAYTRYLHARDGLADAFKGKELYDRIAYERAQQNYRVYEETVETVISDREKAEQEALELYRQAVDAAVARASQEYRERMKRARAACMKETEKAWRDCIETSAKTSSIFQDDKVPMMKTSSSESRIAATLAQVGNKALAFRTWCSSSFRRGIKSVTRLQSSPRSGVQSTAVDAEQGPIPVRETK